LFIGGGYVQTKGSSCGFGGADLKICLSASSADAEIVGTDSLDVGWGWPG
jgi:hypothetical protein